MLRAVVLEWTSELLGHCPSVTLELQRETGGPLRPSSPLGHISFPPATLNTPEAH